MKTITWSLLGLLLVIFLPATGLTEVKENAVLYKYVQLYPREGSDPYTLYYPIEVNRPGPIDVVVNIHSLQPKPQKKLSHDPLEAILVDSRAFEKISPSEWQKWCKKINKFNPVEYIAGDKIRSWVNNTKRRVRALFGKKKKKPNYFHGQMSCGRVVDGMTDNMLHAVDDPELRKTGGRYVVILRNSSPFTAKGTLYISYPGERSEMDVEAERAMKCHADLAVTDVRLNKNKEITATIVNNSGCGGVPIGRWVPNGPEAITLIATIEGRNYGRTLPSADPNGHLRRPNSSIQHVFKNLKITKPTEVKVTVDASNKLIEDNEKNNSRTVTLGPRTFKAIPKAPLIRMDQ